MSSPAVSHRPLRAERAPRQIVLRTFGHTKGAITRLVSPDDIGRRLKPFVFLDYFEGEPEEAPKFGFHPHSGIATLTLILSGQVTYKETTDREGVIETGGVEWMRAGSGVWHTGGAAGKERIKGFQLWVALPPALELSEPESQYLPASAFHSVGPARVIAGEYRGTKSSLSSPDGMTYLDVHLRAGERWTFQPSAGHTVAWIAAHQGTVATPLRVSASEAVVFEESETAIEFEAVTDSAFVLGSAVKHPYDLVTGKYSVHTTAAALRKGEQRIAALGAVLSSKAM
jgi:redox-sensitive bicupin YhaK (pirin superfamily)